MKRGGNDFGSLKGTSFFVEKGEIFRDFGAMEPEDNGHWRYYRCY